MKKKKKARTRADTSSKGKFVKKIKKQATKRKNAAPKTRNEGTMTESGFWSYIRSALRQKSRFWKPILAIKNAAKIPYVGPNKRQKFAYICGECKGEYSAKEVNVHHIEECGSLQCADDLPGFVNRLFCEKEGLILLCNGCHDRKHGKL